MRDTAFKVDRAILLSALSRVMDAVPSRSPMEILQNIEFVLAGGVLTVSATDLHIRVSARVPVKSKASCRFLLGADRIERMLSVFTEADVEFSVGAEKVGIVSGKSKNTVRIYPGELPDPFKDFSGAMVFTMDGSVLAEALRTTMLALPPKPTFGVLDNCYLHIDTKNIVFVGAWQGMVAEVTENISGVEGAKESNILLSEGVCRLIAKAFSSSSAIVSISDGSVRVEDKDTVVTARTEMGEYPAYKTAIPKAFEKKIVIEREFFSRAISRVSAASQDKTYSDFRLDVQENNVHLFSEDLNGIAQSEEDIDIIYEGEEESRWYDARQITPLIGALMGEKMEMGFASKAKLTSMVSTENPDVKLYIMPKKH